MRVGGGEECPWGLGMKWADGERIPWHQAQEWDEDLLRKEEGKQLDIRKKRSLIGHSPALASFLPSPGSCPLHTTFPSASTPLWMLCGSFGTKRVQEG